MGRSPCCEKLGLKKGPWTPEEDQMLLVYIEKHGHGSWRSLPAKAGLQRCGKSCRLRWTNYLRPDIKRGKFSLQEEQKIVQLHALLGNRWSAIATHLPQRTDNEIKNYWNTHLKKRLTKMGVDPITHKPKNDVLGSIDGQAKNDSNLSHTAQWECARLEAEARLVRESKRRSGLSRNKPGSSGSDSLSALKSTVEPPAIAPANLSLNMLKAWQGVSLKSTKTGFFSSNGSGRDFESPKSTVSFSEITQTLPPAIMESTGSSGIRGILMEEGAKVLKGFEKSTHFPLFKEGLENSMIYASSFENEVFTGEKGDREFPASNFIEGFTDLLLNNLDHRNSSDDAGDSNNVEGNSGDENEENKNYWSNILELMNSSPSRSPVF